MINCKDCEKLCCKDSMMPIEVQLEDLKLIAKEKKLTLDKAFDIYCRIAPFTVQPPSLYRVGIALKNPCAFLGDGCKIYDIRPSTCRLFPENVAADEKRKESMQNRYPCVLDAKVDAKELEKLKNKIEKDKEETDKKIFSSKLFLIELKHYKNESLRLHASMKELENKNMTEQAQVFFVRKMHMLDQIMNSGVAKYIDYKHEKAINMDMRKFVLTNLKNL
ncbi:YkgJ family cysteine cluster protein [Candidatus Woesearchaeota archaeon]|nr:YkgJ family cysteine cluster protein [Candidatus Woesearchaeota archaeon]